MQGGAAGRIERLRETLGPSLFPEPERGRGFERWEGAILLIAFLALAIVLQLFRVGPENALESIWAEDGVVFLLHAQTFGFLDNVTSSYAGYLVLVPRLIGEVGAAVPLRQAAVTITLLSTAVVALSGLVVWFAAAGHIRNPYLRGLLVALTVLSPVASLEAVASASYVSWYMTFAVFWVLLWRPATTWGAALAGLFVLATGLSSPGIAFFLPLAMLRTLVFKDRRDALILGPYALALAVQLPVALLTDEKLDAVWSSDIFTSYMQRVVDASVFGEQLGGELWVRWGWPFLIAIVALVAVGLLAATVRSSSGRLLAAIAVTTSLAMFVISTYQRAVGTAMMWPENVQWGLGGRYAIIPSLLLISAALVFLDRLLRSPWSPRRSWPGLAAGIVLLISLVTSFSVADSAIRGKPSWQDSLRAGLAACEAEEVPAVAVGTSPPGVGLPIACDRLRSEFDVDPAR